MQDHKRNKFVPLTVEAEDNQTVYALAKIKAIENELDAVTAHFDRMRSELQVAREESVNLATLAWNAGNILSIDLMQAEIKKRNDLCEYIDKVLESTPKQSLAAIKVKTLREVLAVLTGADKPEETAAFLVEDMIEQIEKEG